MPPSLRTQLTGVRRLISNRCGMYQPHWIVHPANLATPSVTAHRIQFSAACPQTWFSNIACVLLPIDTTWHWHTCLTLCSLGGVGSLGVEVMYISYRRVIHLITGKPCVVQETCTCLLVRISYLVWETLITQKTVERIGYCHTRVTAPAGACTPCSSSRPFTLH
jgi:hypothetical protein